MRKVAKGAVFDEQELRKDLMCSAKAVGIPAGAIDSIVDSVTKRVTAKVTKRSAITEEDLNRFIADEANRYNSDLAYVYKNRGKII